MLIILCRKLVKDGENDIKDRSEKTEDKNKTENKN